MRAKGTMGDPHDSPTAGSSHVIQPPSTRTQEHIENYSEYLRQCAASGDDALVSQRFLRAMDATCREFADCDEAMGMPDDIGTDEEAQVFRLAFIRSCAALVRVLKGIVRRHTEHAVKCNFASCGCEDCMAAQDALATVEAK